MEELLNKTGIFGFIGIIIGIITQINRLKPITLLTAHEIESKLFSKETQFFVRATKFTFEIFLTAGALLAFSMIFFQLDTTLEPPPKYVYFIYVPVISIPFFGSLYINDIKGKTPAIISENILVFVFLYLIYVLVLFSLPGYLFAAFVGPVLNDKQIEWNSNLLFAFILIMFFFLLFIPIILRLIIITVYKAFLLGRINNRQLFVKIESKKWYPQYRMKEDFIILSDSPIIELSNKFKFIDRNEFLKLTLFHDIQKTDQDIIDNTIQAYNSHAEIIDQINTPPWKVRERDLFLYRLHKENQTSLLEIGAGTGKDSLYFQQNGLKVTAIDISEEMVRLCKAKGISEVHCIDVREMNFPPSCFDAVYTLNCLFHIPKTEMNSVLRKIRRILKPNGLLYFGVIGGKNREEVWKQDIFEPQRFFSFYSDNKIKKLVKKYFILEDFYTMDIGMDKLHYQAMILRKREGEFM